LSDLLGRVVLLEWALAWVLEWALAWVLEWALA
jgi:hypothetical protein